MQALTGVLPAGSHLFEFNCHDQDTSDYNSDIDDACISAIVIGSG